MTTSPQPWTQIKPNAAIVLADGTIIEGFGCGATGVKQAELCFNTALTGYQEILTDTSYAGQVVTFTFPHIGNVGTNAQDLETLLPEKYQAAAGAVFKAEPTTPSNYRATHHLDDWMKENDIIGICGVDTRALTNLVREKGLTNCVIAHKPDGDFDFDALKEMAASWSGLEGADLAKDVGLGDSAAWKETPWVWNEGFDTSKEDKYHIVAIDFGVKRNILRLLAGLGCKITIMPANSTAEAVLEQKPDGIFLSNGPGDPAATGAYSVEMIKGLLKPIFPCLVFAWVTKCWLLL